MKAFILTAALLHLAAAGHVEVKMPYLHSAGVTYVQGHEQQFYVPNPYEAAHYQPQQVAYPAQGLQYQAHHAYAKAPAAIGVAHVPVKTHVAVPTVHHVPAVADVPVTKYEAQPAVLQKIVDVAKPAIKTRKFEIRRPAIQKQFYDIEERIVVRPAGSALVELEEPLSKKQKGPALVQTVEDGHVSVAAHHEAPVAVHHESQAAYHHEIPVAVHHDASAAYHHEASAAYHHQLPLSAHHEVAVTAAPSHTVAITPVPHAAHYVSTIAPAHSYEQPSLHHLEHQYAQQQQAYASHQYVSQAPIHVTSPHTLVSSTPAPYLDESVVVEAAARNAAAKEAAYARAHLHNSQHGIESYSNGAPHEQILVNNAHHAIESYSTPAPQHVLVKGAHHVELKNVDQLRHEEAQDNQQKLIKLLTARGGVAEVGFEKHGHLEAVGDAGISRARVLSATPTPHHEPVDEKFKTRRIVVSRPVQTVQEIDVVEPATKIEQVAIQQPTYIKTAKVGYERVHTSVPVLGKALAPAIAHAQVPVEYYHH